MNTSYHIGKLEDHIYNNYKKGLIGKHLRALESKNENKELEISEYDQKVLKKK
ncbi:hypothetical protein ACSTS3_21205 [Aquimarina muelleri]|uniref:hypothetical protein n=1 Tax=Aquimarina muelleri TaxID=279356 RepID=UPI003F684B96